MTPPGTLGQAATAPEGIDHPAAIPLADAVAEPERIIGIDLARGLAILGIFMVNMQLFAQPIGLMMTGPGPLAGSGPLDVLAHYFVAIFCAGKFYPLFSTLFGIGLMIQLDRARRGGRRFVPPYLRRLATLCVLGLIHGLLLWWGDILFVYSITGLVLFAVVMIFRNISARALLITGIVLILLGTAQAAAINYFLGGSDADSNSASTMPADESESAPATSPAATLPSTKASGEAQEVDSSISHRFMEAMRNNEMKKGPGSPLWIELETAAYREGSYLDMLFFRAITWLIALALGVFAGFITHVLGMFFIGAAMFRAGLLSSSGGGTHRRLLLGGALVGLPLVVLGTYIPEAPGIPSGIAHQLANILNMLAGPLMSLAYLGGALMLVASGALPVIVGAVSRVGRMALTNYLTETLVATFIMYSYGLGWFGSALAAQQVLIVLTVYGALLITSTIWLRYFQFGPMEWLWRTLTYLRPQPMLRR